MTSVNFQQWIQHPETLDRDTLYELRNMLARYPYFQSLRLLYLKNLYILHDINFGAELRKAVLYIADRRKLFQLIEGDRFAVQSRKKGVPLTEVLKNEPSVDRTLALIDAFLSTVPEEVEGLYAEVVVPIICEGDAIGSVALFSRDQRTKMGDTELKLAQTAAGFLGRQMES